LITFRSEKMVQRKGWYGERKRHSEAARKNRTINYNKKKYRITGYASSTYPDVEYRVKTKTKDYGWQPVKNYAIREKIGKKYHKKQKSLI